MLRTVSGTQPPTEGLDEILARQAIWIDLESPDDEERMLVERAAGLRLPTQASISEVENSSRLAQEGDTLRLSTPMISRDNEGVLHVSQLGFVLTRERLITLRFAPSRLFQDFAERWRAPAHPGGMQPFLGLIEAMTDRLADMLEHQSAVLDDLSRAVFGVRTDRTLPSRRRDAALRVILTELGQTGDLISRIRDGLLGLLRIARYVTEAAASWLQEGEGARLKIVEHDLLSLTDYDAQETAKVQFLLDATLGYISIEQNNSIKVLTVVSLVGIPPTLIASIYGMNFKVIPELNWNFGYYYALGLIAASVVLPLLWFRRRGWL